MTNRNSVLRKHATVYCVVALGFLLALGCTPPVEDSPADPAVENETSGLSAEDLVLVEQQGICPVSQSPLGSMGDPIKVDVNGTPVFICCKGCRARLLADPEKYLAMLENGPSEEEPTIEVPEVPEALAGLSPGDLILVDQQKICPVMKTPLGSMGEPIKVDVNGTPIFICCEGCRSKLLADPEMYLANLE
jgi:hypothetical protein